MVDVMRILILALLIITIINAGIVLPPNPDPRVLFFINGVNDFKIHSSSMLVPLVAQRIVLINQIMNIQEVLANLPDNPNSNITPNPVINPNPVVNNSGGIT